MTDVAKTAVMSEAHERFVAFTDTVKWVYAVVKQRDAMRESETLIQPSYGASQRPKAWIETSYRQVIAHYFCIATMQMKKHADWAREKGLFSSVDFSDLDAFDWKAINDVRDMREHVTEYFQSVGRYHGRWSTSEADGISDASAIKANSIGGRLDFEMMGTVAEKLLRAMEVLPFPSSSP